MINFSHLKSGKKTPPDLLKIQQQNLKKVVADKKISLAEKKAGLSGKNSSESATKKQTIIDAENRPESGPSEPIKNRDKIELVEEVIGEKIPPNLVRDFSPEKVSGKFKSTLIESGQVFEKHDPIVGTLYCVGCLRSSIEKLGTPREVFYCERDRDKDGIVNFVRIKPEVVIGQCRYRLDKKKPF